MSVRFQEQCNLCASAKSVASRVRIDFERALIGGGGKDVLNRVGILRGLGWQRSDFDPICNQETTVETETECTNQIAVCASRLVTLNIFDEFRGPRFREGALDSELGNVLQDSGENLPSLW